MAKVVNVVQQAGPMNRRRHLEHQNEKYHYHFARNDPDRIRDLCDLYDYEIVRQGDAKVTGDKGSLEGAVTAGGDVLLRCPIEKWKEREAEKEAAVRAQLEGPRETFKTEAQKANVGTLDKSSMKRGPMSSVMGKQD